MFRELLNAALLKLFNFDRLVKLLLTFSIILEFLFVVTKSKSANLKEETMQSPAIGI